VELNPSLITLEGPNMNAAASVSINNNDQLVSITGFENLVGIFTPIRGVNIISNPALTNINGFGMMEDNAVNVSVRGNTSLQACGIDLICRQIGFGNSPTVISNAPGCQSIQDATDQCNGVPIITDCPTQPLVLIGNNNNCQAAAPDFSDLLTVIDTDNSQAQLSFTSNPMLGSALSDGDMVLVTVTDPGTLSTTCNIMIEISCSALPVTLTAFNGSIVGKNNVLGWTAASEEAFSHYEVQRSESGTDEWVILGAAAGTMEGFEEQGYTYTDIAPLPSSYYRLRMVDLDGTPSFSPIVHLERATSRGELTVYPNPTSGQININLPIEDGENAGLILFDLSGQKLFQTKTISSRYEQHLNLPPGVYLLSAETTSGRWTRRVIVR
jgi:hypothetical protein